MWRRPRSVIAWLSVQCPCCSEVWMHDRCGNGFLIRKNLREPALDCLQHCRDQWLADGQCGFQVVKFFLRMHMVGKRYPIYIFVSDWRMFSAFAMGFMTRTYSSKNATSVLVDLATSSLVQSFLDSSSPRSLISRIIRSMARYTEFQRVEFGRLSPRPYASVTASTINSVWHFANVDL